MVWRLGEAAHQVPGMRLPPGRQPGAVAWLHPSCKLRAKGWMGPYNNEHDTVCWSQQHIGGQVSRIPLPLCLQSFIAASQGIDVQGALRQAFFHKITHKLIARVRCKRPAWAFCVFAPPPLAHTKLALSRHTVGQCLLAVIAAMGSCVSMQLHMII